MQKVKNINFGVLQTNITITVFWDNKTDLTEIFCEDSFKKFNESSLNSEYIYINYEQITCF